MSQYFTYQNQSIGTGDTIRVYQEIQEGEKKRLQFFEGIVIAIRNSGINQTFTVRKIGANGVGVEKIYPTQMPALKKIVIKKKGKVRRAKLYYLRDKVGKAATKIKESKTLIKKTVDA